jgi:amino acid adenylation domain-containing protein
MVMLAAFDIVLGRSAGQEDVVVGTPIAGRGRTELEGLIGFFVNTLVLRTDLAGNPSFRELLARVKRVALDAYAHQDLPFEKLVESLNPERDRSYAPIVQALFTFHNQPVRKLSLDNLSAEPQEISSDMAKFDLSLHVSEHAGRMTLAFAYNSDLFEERTIVELASYYEAVLTAVASSPELRVGDLGLPSAREADAADDDRAVSIPVSDSVLADRGDVVERFAARVVENPKRVALRSTMGSTMGSSRFTWSYGALNACANRVAYELLFSAVWARQSGAVTETEVPRIGLMADHDAPLVAGLMGILKAGAAYVPLDPDLPAAVLAGRMQDAGVSALVADELHLDAAHSLVSDTGVPVISIPEDAVAVSDPVVTIDPEGLAYILYTSGTTGEPKGVVQTHRGVLQQITAYSQGLGLVAGDRLSWLSGFGFDAAVQDIFGALLNGASVCPVSVREAPGSVLMDTVLAAGVTVLHATPTVYRHLLGGELNCGHDLSGIRLVVLGGETARRSDFELFKSRFSRGTVFVNGLGLTESSVGLQFYADHDTRLPGQVVPVGDAVAGIEVELLDTDGQPGWYGEITLRGAGVARGYWQRDALTRERFEVFAGEVNGGVRAYRTGDIGRRLPDGRIVHVGRLDDQVKVRGYRIELGEIETVLSGHPDVAECVASVDRPPGGEARLVVYVVATAGAEISISALRGHLEAGLPGYMLPQAVEVLAALPRLANGKVDRGQLPAPRWGRDAEQAYVPARTELEAVLTEIWLEVLEVDKVGVHDDFFALGGHSLLATRLISRVRDRLELEVPLSGIFADPTLEGLAKTVVRTRAQTADGIEVSDSMPAIVTIPRVKRGASRVRN